MKILSFFFLFLLLLPSVWAGNYIYKGNINENLSVTMLLSVEGEHCTGKYFYDKLLKDIPLKGSNVNGQWRIEETGGGFFQGSFNSDFSQFSGSWQQPEKGKNYAFSLKLLLPSDPKKTLDFQKIRQFQTLLNLFETRLSLPIKLDNKLKNLKLYNDKKEILTTNALPKLPYSLARQFIMNQTKLKVGNYFNIDENHYIDSPYRAVGELHRTGQWVALLFYFDDEASWDEYQMFFAQIFDFEGNMISEWKAYTYYITEKTGEQSSEKIISSISANLELDIKTMHLKIKYGVDANTGKEYCKDEEWNESLLYKIDNNGKLIKK